MTKRWNSNEIIMTNMRKIGRRKNDDEINTWQFSTCESRYFEKIWQEAAMTKGWKIGQKEF